MRYEVVIERQQPACGGKDPKEVKILSVETQDPEAYVREHEPVGEMEKTVKENGDIEIHLEQGLKNITYTFTLDE